MVSESQRVRRMHINIVTVIKKQTVSNKIVHTLKNHITQSGTELMNGDQ